MPRLQPPLTDKQVRSYVKEPCDSNSTKAVGGAKNLRIQKTPSGASSWIFRIDLEGRRRSLGLGSYPEVDLKTARDIARDLHRQIARGIDIWEERLKAKVEAKGEAARRVFFEDLAESYYANQVEGGFWSNGKHIKQWISTLRTYAFPVIGKMVVEDVTKHDVVKVLRPIWGEKHETATRVRQRIETVFKHAIALDIRVSPNPASKDLLNSLLVTPASAKAQKHQPHLPFERVPAFFKHLRESSSVSAKVLEFKILTNIRNTAAEHAMWSEIDFERKVWNVPVTRNGKSKVPFECALSDAAIALVKSMPKRGKYLFPSPYREDMPLSIGCADMIDKLQEQKFKRTGRYYVDPTELDADGNPRKIVAHGFRSSFRSCMAAKTLFNSDTVEKCMQHDGDKLHQAYQRSNLLEIRLEIMNSWASWCNGEEI